MFDKNHIKLSRGELLELLISEREKNEELKRQLQEARNELTSKEIIINNAGSIAEAALALNGLFEAADKACAQYKENLERLYKEEKKAKSCQKLEKNIHIVKIQKVKDNPQTIEKKKIGKKTHKSILDKFKDLCK